MDFALEDSQVLLRDTTRKFMEAQDCRASLRARIESPETTDPAEWKLGAGLGWASMLIPEEHGGGSVTHQPLVDLAVLAEEMGRLLYPAPFIPTNVVADALARAGGHGDLLARIAGGEVLAAWCLSGDGTVDPGAVSVEAVPDGGSYRLDGVARFVEGASVAGTALVLARSGGEVAHFLAPLGNIRVMSGLDLTRRLCEVAFDHVTGAVRVGGTESLERALQVATVLQAAEALGGADHLIAETVRYAKDRVQFGRPIGSFQAIKHRLADLHLELEGMRAATYYAALAVADGLPDAADAVAVAGSYVVDAYAWICGEALQVHGGIGFTWEHDVHLYIRRAKADQVLYGEPHRHRERLCGLIEERL